MYPESLTHGFLHEPGRYLSGRVAPAAHLNPLSCIGMSAGSAMTPGLNSGFKRSRVLSTSGPMFVIRTRMFPEGRTSTRRMYCVGFAIFSLPPNSSRFLLHCNTIVLPADHLSPGPGHRLNSGADAVICPDTDVPASQVERTSSVRMIISIHRNVCLQTAGKHKSSIIRMRESHES